VFRDSIGKWMPFNEGAQMTVIDRKDVGGDQLVGHLFSRPVAIVYFFAVIIILVLIGLVLADRRDA
jgi:hypothetical protein